MTIVGMDKIFYLVLDAVPPIHHQKAQPFWTMNPKSLQVPEYAGAVGKNKIAHEDVCNRKRKPEASLKGNLQGDCDYEKNAIADIPDNALLQAPAKPPIALAGDSDAGQRFTGKRYCQHIKKDKINTQRRASRADGRAKNRLFRKIMLKLLKIVIETSYPVDVIHLQNL